MPSQEKVSKWLRKVRRFLKSECSEQRRKKKKIKVILKDLKARQKTLEHRIKKGVKPEKEQRMKEQIHLIKAQRKKALAVIQDLREESKG